MFKNVKLMPLAQCWYYHLEIGTVPELFRICELEAHIFSFGLKLFAIFIFFENCVFEHIDFGLILSLFVFYLIACLFAVY